MPRLLLLLTLFGLVLAGLSGWLLNEAFNRSPGTIVSEAPNLLDQVRHPVTEPMLARTEAIKGLECPEIILQDSFGKPLNLADQYKNGPLVLVFTKVGCPCSMEAQPFFNELAKKFGEGARFVGVIDGAPHDAARYREDLNVTYPMALAGGGAMFKLFDVKRSVYVSLVGRDGKVVKQWPGYNKEMLQDLNKSVAKQAGRDAIVQNVSEAPDELSSGCAFDAATPNGE
ncbi:MAG: redoxin domain-containing protein [Fimbriimonadaceae bacterium]|nr:redoxin domain-containing protein [Fimbriimonadaceae bacterium]QYK56353.1 MAG: redoxin domain-containing protein [Fimbriimonadaceae bacterium]